MLITPSLLATSADPVGSTPQDFAAFFRREIERYAEVIRKGKVQVE